MLKKLHRWFKLQYYRHELSELNMDMMFFAIPFKEYEKEHQLITDKIDALYRQTA